MPYPSPPWFLRGHAFQTVQWVACDRLRPLLPAGLDIIQLLPNLTIGGIYLASYEAGSDLEYHELIVAAGIVRHANTIGAWISHIYVDNPDSVAGGREIWGLPKELAQFTWEMDKSGQMARQVTVRQGDRLLCTCRYDWRLPLWRQAITIPILSHKDAAFLWFTGTAQANVALIGAQLTVPSASPFAGLKLDHPWLTVAGDALNLTANPPQ